MEQGSQGDSSEAVTRPIGNSAGMPVFISYATLEYFLSGSQWIDVPALGMKGALAKLASALPAGVTTATATTATAINATQDTTPAAGSSSLALLERARL